MAMTLTVAHTKGGVGKTTTAVFLAAAAHIRGIDVELLDADPQSSATEWGADADAAQDPFPWPVRTVVKARRIRSSDLRPSAELTILDTPPGDPGLIQPAINAADLVLVPTGVSPIDVRRVWPTLEATTNRPTAVLLTGVALNTRLTRDVREIFEEEGLAVLRTPILRREGIKQSYGTTPSYPLYGYDDVLTEILEAMQ